MKTKTAEPADNSQKIDRRKKQSFLFTEWLVDHLQQTKLLPQMSNFYCHPGRAGGTPN